MGSCTYRGVRGARCASLYNLHVLDGELDAFAGVKVGKGDGDFGFHVVAATLAVAVACMAAAAEEAGEEVEGVVVAVSAAAAALLVLFVAFVAVLVVDAAGVGVGESFVGFGYFDEFLVGFFTFTVKK